MITNLQHLQLTDTLTRVPGRCPEGKRFFTIAELYPVEIEQALHLNLRTLTVFDDPTEESCGLKEILKVTPGLEVIRGVNQSTESLIHLLSSIFGLRFHWNSDHLPRPLSNLRHLDLMASFGIFAKECHWRSKYPPEGAAAGIQLPLETLAFRLETIWEYPTLAEDFRNFFNSFSSTLKTLKAFRAPVGGKPYFNFLSNCSMGLLTEMYLWGPIAPNFEFLRETPNLNKLGIDLGCYEKSDLLPHLIHSFPNRPARQYEKYQGDMALNVWEDWRDGILCAKLEYLEVDFEFPEESLRLMGQWMPNLRTLKTILNEDSVPVVCEVWGNLTELVCLHGSKIGNSCFVWGDEEVAEFSGDAGPKKLKICDLADLKRFQLDANCGEAELTDEVVFNGFLKMTSLKCVEICVNSQMSEEAEKALRKGIQFCKVVCDDHCAGAGVDTSGWEFGRKSGCDRCDFRRINEIHRFTKKALVHVEDDGGSEPSFGEEGDEFWGSGDSDNSYDF